METSDLKKIEKIKDKIKKRFPNAKCIKYNEGYVIFNIGENIFEEFFLPPAPDVLNAWERALLTNRTIQNFTRTHPLRAESADQNKKLERMIKRKIRADRKKDLR